MKKANAPRTKEMQAWIDRINARPADTKSIAAINALLLPNSMGGPPPTARQLAKMREVIAQLRWVMS